MIYYLKCGSNLIIKFRNFHSLYLPVTVTDVVSLAEETFSAYREISDESTVTLRGLKGQVRNSFKDKHTKITLPHERIGKEITISTFSSFVGEISLLLLRVKRILHNFLDFRGATGLQNKHKYANFFLTLNY